MIDPNELFAKGYDLPANKFPPEHRDLALGWCAVWLEAVQTAIAAKTPLTRDVLWRTTKLSDLALHSLHIRVFEALFMCTCFNNDLISLFAEES